MAAVVWFFHLLICLVVALEGLADAAVNHINHNTTTEATGLEEHSERLTNDSCQPPNRPECPLSTIRNGEHSSFPSSLHQLLNHHQPSKTAASSSNNRSRRHKRQNLIAKPTDLNWEVYNTTAIHLTWKGQGDYYYIKIYQTKSLVDDKDNITGTDIILNGLTPSGSYTCQIQAKTSSGDKSLFAEFPRITMSSDELTNAIMNNDTTQVELLLKNGIDINGKGPGQSETPPVFRAINLGMVEMMEVLLEYCPDRTAVKNYSKPEKGVHCALSDTSTGMQICNMEEAAEMKGDATMINVVKKYLSKRCGKCPGEGRSILNKTYQLSPTKSGGILNISCPSNSGSGTWKCGDNFLWENTPDLSECRNLQNIFMPPYNGTASLPAAENITNLAERIKDEKLLPGDVLDIIQWVKQFQIQQDIDMQKNDSDAPSRSKSYLSALVNITDKILEEPQIWDLMPPKEAVKNISTFQEKSIAKAALTAAKYIAPNTTLRESKENIDVLVVSQTKAYYKKKENREYKHLFFMETLIRLPDNFWDNYTSSNGSKGYDNEHQIVVVFTSYRNRHCQTNDIPCVSSSVNGTTSNIHGRAQVNSVAIGATVGYGLKWYAGSDESVELNFSHIYNGLTYNLKNPKCVWWDTENSSWSSDGCVLHNFTDSYSICHCNHLSILAVTMDINGILSNSKYREPLKWITIIGCSLSIICLALCVLCFIFLKNDREKKKKAMGAKKYLIRLNLCACLLLAELVLLLGLEATSNKGICTTVAVTLHFFFLAAFTWSAIEALNLYLAMIKVFEAEISQKHYLIIGYGTPCLIVGLTLAISGIKGYGTKDWCWLERARGTIWSFAGVVLCIMIINIVAFVMAMRIVWKKRNLASSKTEAKSSANKVMGSIAIFLALGLTWITGFLYMAEGTDGLAVVFTVLNSLQGVGIFLFAIIFDKRTRMELLSLIRVKMQDKGLLPAVRSNFVKAPKKSKFVDDNVEDNNETTEETLSINVTDSGHLGIVETNKADASVTFDEDDANTQGSCQNILTEGAHRVTGEAHRFKGLATHQLFYQTKTVNQTTGIVCLFESVSTVY